GTAAGGVAVAANYGAVLELNPGLSFTRAEPLTINSSGFNYRGAVRALAGAATTWAGPVTIGAAGAVIGADAGATLNIGYTPVSVAATGGASGQAVVTTASTTGLYVGMPITGTGVPEGSTVTAITANTNFTISNNLTATAAGNYTTLTGGMAAGTNAFVVNAALGGVVNFNQPILTTTAGFTNYGAGTVNFNAASTAMIGALDVRAGNVNLNGVALGGTGAISLRSSGKLTVVEGATTSNLLGSTRSINLLGGELVMNAAAATAASTETFSGGLVQSARGATVFTAIPSATAGATLSLGALGGRSVFGTTLLFRGVGVATGAAAAAGTAAIYSTNWNANSAGLGTDGTFNKVVLPYAFVSNSATGDAQSFATFTSAADNIRALTSAEYIGTPFKDQNVRLSAAASNLGASFKVNSLQMDAGASLFLAPTSVLTLAGTAGAPGAILATDNVTINNGLITAGAASDVLLYVNADKTLTLNAALTGSSGGNNVGFNKSGAGTLVLNRSSLISGQYTINQGTVKLGAGNGTLWGYNQGNANSYFSMNGGTLDLNGTTQVIGGLFQDNQPADSTPVITSTGGAATFVSNAADARDFAGTITGPVGFAYGNTGAATLTLWSNNTYTGPTLVNGGVLQLAGNAQLSGTSSIELSYGALYLNNNADVGGALVNNRIPDTAPITMRGGRLYFYGRNWSDAQENLGVVTIAGGGSDLHILAATPT
ncbi:hypothetical protein EBR16_05660, partial [bacterium]|nr:hypothetical protein [bacterium]